MLDPNRTIGQLVAERPSRARVFERFGIDYCCGGQVPLARACAAKGLSVAAVLREIEANDLQVATSETVDWVPETLGRLIDFIVATHHAYLRRELPRLTVLIDKVAAAHGGRHPELNELRSVFASLREGLEAHLAEEEQVAFPLIKQLEAARAISGSPPIGLADSLRDMEREHDEVGAALARLRTLTGGYAPPADACNTFRAMLNGLAELETDLHYHVHRENNILFPGAKSAEAEMLAGAPMAGRISPRPLAG
ncbi:MAG: iron-sulfur cluster repair di-iron protein [Isosphaeraceae bacterium]|nr:iron-sulfur cluster repair di-iron protein [Isosphaeraceae bacterium]